MVWVNGQEEVETEDNIYNGDDLCIILAKVWIYFWWLFNQSYWTKPLYSSHSRFRFSNLNSLDASYKGRVWQYDWRVLYNISVIYFKLM